MYLVKNIEEVISLRMRELRGKRTQAEMAEILNIPFRTYQTIESGSIPRSETRKTISETLNISETYLFLDPDLTSPTTDQALDVLEKALNSREKPTELLTPDLARALKLLSENPDILDGVLAEADLMDLRPDKSKSRRAR